MDKSDKFVRKIKNKEYEVWYSEFNRCWLLVRNNLTILDAGEKDDMINKLNSIKNGN